MNVRILICFSMFIGGVSAQQAFADSFLSRLCRQVQIAVLGEPFPKETTGISLPNEKVARKWAEKNFGTWWKQLNYEERAAIKRYGFGFAYAINRHLRGVEETVPPYRLEAIQKTIESLDSAFLHGKLREDVILHRKVLTTANNSPPYKWEDLKPGGIVAEKAYSSTVPAAQSLDVVYGKSHPEDFIHLIVEAPAGTPALYIEDRQIVGNTAQGVEEILLPRNIEFEVLEKWVDKSGERIVRVRPKNQAI